MFYEVRYYLISQSRLHELVYAKLTGYPYWPAKVMEVKPDGCDVRFFGPGHHRYYNNSNTIDTASNDILLQSNALQDS